MSSNNARSVGGVGNTRHSSVASAEAATSQLLGALLDQLVALRLDVTYEMMPRYERGTFADGELQLIVDRLDAAIRATKNIVASLAMDPLSEQHYRLAVTDTAIREGDGGRRAGATTSGGPRSSNPTASRSRRQQSTGK